MSYESYKFELKPLNYAYDALEPHIDAQTVHLHHNKHLQTYVDNLNKTLEPYPNLWSLSLEKLVKYWRNLPLKLQTPVRNNAGGVYNHNLYFEIITPGTVKFPVNNLGNAIDKKFGSYNNFKTEFKNAALNTFGSGYACLVSDFKGRASIKSVPNQDTTLPQNLYPLILIDVWEHSYYLKYHNLRADYIDNWFDLVNWEIAENNYNSIVNTRKFL